ncbi:MAG: nucleotidyl transferase AbiEii/AbiGii toxin family protein [Deltaproteobacteria bacterium]|nr:nucleotidyl transferase AbiEii/AbiGii toxin family protein [Deltaproteobacteria bacterium]
MDADLVLSLLRALNASGVRYKVVGGVALNLHGLPRATRDLDIFVAPDAENVSRLRLALDSVFHDPEIAGITEDDLAGAYPAVQYVPPTGFFHVDIVARLGDAWSYDDIEASPVVVDGVSIPVATPTTLVRMKAGTVRPQDHADAARLRARFGVKD